MCIHIKGGTLIFILFKLCAGLAEVLFGGYKGGGRPRPQPRGGPPQHGPREETMARGKLCTFFLKNVSRHILFNELWARIAP